jgi:DNA-binding protein YbaB
MTIEGEWASANAALMAQAEKFEADMKTAQAELEKKHAFEDARRAG